ncbi:cobaltochelatase subunit CobN [Lyngbya confervoides]|uniref:Cobaltochelatase subunit CobN n=1 Tax=Lyngbya confervoides BDU141951 TaxID=1574623 RepID=A0ABD4T5E1_9CYAN|nr:cobaltochelatase subunit CobN [Lyngbya confervoides]MCM1983874.1 cobaltochelatase subunit CobN [Lyngbya confervoides BDU141951]
MHRLAAIPGGFDPSTQAEGVIFIDQTPAPIVILTAADTDIQMLAAALPTLPPKFPAVRVVNLLQLQQQITLDTYAEAVLEQAQVIIVRLLGGKAYWPYGLEVIQDTAAKTQADLWVLPGDEHPDLSLMDCSTVAWQDLNQFWRYWLEGGIENLCQGLQFVANRSLQGAFTPAAPQKIPRVGVLADVAPSPVDRPWGCAAVLFYRAHYLAGNLSPIRALCQALAQQGLVALPIYVQSLQDPEVQQQVLQLIHTQSQSGAPVAVMVNTTSFSLARISGETLNLSLWKQLNIPILQAICSSGTEIQWQQQLRGLSPRDMAMNVALPEVDGRIISRAISFKGVEHFTQGLETAVVTYQPVSDRIEFVAALAKGWGKLRQTPVDQKRVALVLANYPNRDGRLANGVGLDTPTSCVRILQALDQAGYFLSSVPADSEALMQALTAGITNDPEGRDWRPVHQSLSQQDYLAYFSQLPEAVQRGICDRWGAPDPAAIGFPIAGLNLGHVFVGIQPARGYDLDPSLNYHAPDLVPPHAYLAFYFWLRHQFQVQAVVHVGKHGNLEWLPGKSIALSQNCYPEAVLGPLPHLYPFIVNDPGEGAQAKRRSQAVIIDHLTPPLTRAELYGPLQTLEALIDEYYDAQALDPRRLSVIRDRILALIAQEQLHYDLGLSALGLGTPEVSAPCDLDAFLNQADGYLCELKEAQIRDGLHIFGQCPQGRQLRDLIVSLARCPGAQRLGLREAIAQAWSVVLDPGDLGDLLSPDQIDRFRQQGVEAPLRNRGDAVAHLEAMAATLVDRLLQGDPLESLISGAPLFLSPQAPQTQGLRETLQWLQADLIPALRQTHDEITALVRALAGEYIPSGASGAPTRGRPDVLPTGRNFYSVDIRALPTESAWDVGRRAAAAVIERYTQEQGEYPKTLALSVWGTATMRTGGDDIAQALALLGVQPLWDGPSRRMVDFEIIPLTVLGRPRVDVTLRISGFFRDAFPNLIQLFDQAVQAVAQLQEPEDQNPLAARVSLETQTWLAEGLSLEQAQLRSRFRIFGSKPGAYGAGLQGLIESQNWISDGDLARAFMTWSSYAYTGQAESHAAPEALTRRLAGLEIVLHNQDNREHDVLDSDDYYQFQGGLTAAVRSIQGQNPKTYFGDHSRPDRPTVRSLSEEIARVYRSRVINPKWIQGVMRHGYKGAFEMAATVDYLFAYDAAAHCAADFMYEGIAHTYLLDETVQAFVRDYNPWALRDMAERLLEAHQRGLWSEASPERLEQLRNLVLEAEGVIEAKL